MAFDWSALGAGDPIENEDISEIQANLESIYSTLGINRSGCTGPGWVELPVSGGDPVSTAPYLELRNVIDYAHDNNCVSHNSGHDAAYNIAHDATVEATHDTDHNGSDYATYLSTHNDTVRTSNWTPHNSAYDATVRATYNSGYDSDDYTTHLSIHNDTVR
ncbi:MAG: hypothetical protein WCX99_02310, partial [Candidatus Paceibacterota bacterium]